MKRLHPAIAPSAARTATVVFLLSLLLSPPAASAGTKTWVGLGPDGKWQTGQNWSPSGATAGDSLIFGGSVRLTSTNNFTPGTPFSGISFASGAGIFNLTGNSISLTGDLADSQVVSLETIALNLSLSATHNVDVTPNGLTALNGVVSGVAGAGINKIDGGQLALNGANTFSGPLNITGGNVFISSDGNLGAVPVARTAGLIVLNGGTLTTSNTFTINTNRGIALGPVSGAGSGTINVTTNTVTYRGIIANAGTNGGLNKLSFGSLVLAGSNSYTGPTLISNGAVTLDFTQAVSPTNNLINSSSSLGLGGANSGIGVTNFAELIMIPKAATTNSQTFNGTFVNTGPAAIVTPTNATSATAAANLALGSLTHTIGGVVTIVPQTQFTGGTGHITTTSTNYSGIIGGWAFIGTSGLGVQGVPYATNFATVDASGNITNFTNFAKYTGGVSSGNLTTVIAGTTTTNVMFDGAAGDVRLDNDNNPGSGSTNDINTLKLSRPLGTSWSFQIGSNNVLRLGKYGSILYAPNGTEITWEIGNSTAGNNTIADQNVGTITAGGPTYNTPGELVIMHNSTATSSTANMDIDVKIDDNGPLGPVTFIKAGPGYGKLRGHNTYSGGTYMLGGRLQFAGNDGGANPIGTINPDACGTGNVFVFPGSYLFAPPAGFSNAVFIAGNGSVGEPLGAYRGSGLNTNTFTLIGDATFGGSGGNIGGPISGPFNVILGSAATISSANETISFSSSNYYTGNTFMQASSHGAGTNVFINGANEVIPNGFGHGNVSMSAISATETTTWDLNGYNETINGLITTVFPAACTVTNSTTTNDVLTLGDNDQSGTFGGSIGGNALAVVKIGAGTETLTSTLNYAGSTTISNGTLALSGSATLASSPVQVIGTNTLAAFDVSGVTAGFTSANPVSLTNGTFIGNTAAAGISSFSLTNSALTLLVNPAVTNIFVTTLTTGGTTNLINIGAVQNITAYPSTFNLIKYTGSIGGAGFNFGIGSIPSASTAGYVSNYVAGNLVQLVLTNGPKPLVWTGTNDGMTWDINTTTNWLAFQGTVGAANAPFNNLDTVQFDDTAPAADTNINLVGLNLIPGSLLVSNSSLNYNFTGTGALNGASPLVKVGTASLTVANTGGNNTFGGINLSGTGPLYLVSDNTMSGGATIAVGSTLQVGTNSGTGQLPGGNVQNDGTLIFDRGADLPVGNVISGQGGINKLDAGTLTLSGVNTYTGNVSVVSGILKTGTGSALGVTNGTTTINSGATLDVNGQNLGGEPVIVSGSGVGSAGAIINTGADQINALQNVTVNGSSVTFGGAGRWDIRGAIATAGLFGSAGTYTLTKTGANQVSFVSITVDNNLGDININQGELAFQVLTTSMGNPANTITVNPTGTLDVYNLTTATMTKNLVLNGDGVTTTLFCENGNSILSGTTTLNNTNIFNMGGNSLTFDGSSTFTGPGSLTMMGTSTLALNGTVTLGGPINVTGTTTLNLMNVNTGGGTLTNAPGTTITSGTSSGNNGAVQIGGAILPGGTNSQGIFTVGVNGGPFAPLTLTNATLSFDFINSGSRDQIQVNGGLNLQGTNLIIVSPAVGSIASGNTVDLITYTGSLVGGSNNFAVATPPPGYSWTLLDPATTPNKITLSIVHVPLNQLWVGGNPNNVWDTTNTLNWKTNSVFDQFTPGDVAIFDDTSATKTVAVTGTNVPEDIQFNGSSPYTLSGTGKLSGPGTLEISGGGTVAFANTGTNDFGGAISINNGTLSIGNGGVGGDVGPGTNTLNATLLFNRSDDFTYHNSIASGTGNIVKTNTDVANLTGNSPQFGGSTYVAQGTLKIGSSTAVGTNFSTLVVSNGATLDFPNNVNINVGGNGGGQIIVISGAGVTNGGAIINSSNSATATGPNFANVTMTGDMTIGGIGRLDWYGADLTSANGGSLVTFGHPYNLFKVGTNQLQLQAINIDAGFSNFVVQAGTLGLQGNLPSLGNPTNNLILYTNSTLNLFTLSNVLYKTIIMSNAAIVCQSGSNLWAGPVILQGSNTITITSWLGLSNTISGSGGLNTISGSSILYLPASNTYTGPTYLNSGTLALVNDPNGNIDGSITHSSLIYDSATLDVSGRSDQMLTVVSGQTLAGDGTVNGTVVAASGSTVSPGATTTPGRLTVTTNAILSLGSATLMRVSESPRTNDQLRVSRSGGTLTYGGSLTVTISSGNMHGGESFPLFAASTLSGSFSPVNLPTLGPGLLWNTSALGTTGTISVTGTLTPPTIAVINYVAPTLSLSGTGGSPFGPYVVITSTNITNALSTWSPVVTNHFASDGSFSWSGSVGSTNAQQFFTIRE